MKERKPLLIFIVPSMTLKGKWSKDTTLNCQAMLFLDKNALYL